MRRPRDAFRERVAAWERLPRRVLGVRFLALAVVAGSGTLLPSTDLDRLHLMAGVLAGALLGCVQYVAAARDARSLVLALVPGQVCVWTYLLHRSGGLGSPLFVGYLMEIVLSGTLASRRGSLLAATSGVAAYLLYALIEPDSAPAAHVTSVVGFIGATGVLTLVLIGVLDKQRRALVAYQSALRARAESLAEELRLLGDYLGGALVGIDALGRVASLNPAGARWLGVEPQSVLGRPWQEVLGPDPEGAGRIAHTLAEGCPQRGVRLLLRRPGAVPLSAVAEVWMHPTPEGRRTFVLLDSGAERADGEDPLRRLGEAAACVAHQLKNSLHSLQALALGAAPGASTAEGRSLDQFRQALRSLGDLTEDVMAMAGSATGPDREEVSLRDVVASALVLAFPPPARAEVVLPDEPIVLNVQRGQLVHALFNLLDNARKVAPPHVPVRVVAERDGEQVRIRLSDEGPGIDPALARGRGPTRSVGGHGFGLLAAHRYVEACGGTLEVRSAETGTTCVVTLPCARAEAPPEQEGEGTMPEHEGARSTPERRGAPARR